jgi:hypothetical protein
LRYTQGKDGSTYIIYLPDENERLPNEILIKGFIPAKGAKISMLGQRGSSFRWITGEGNFKILIRESQRGTLPSKYAAVFKVSQILK